MKYTNSNLVSCTILSPNHSGQRTHEIDRITPHCVVGQATAERIGEIFTPTSKQASCNYGIGRDGRIVLVVEEKNRSWCSSSRENDQRAITIEVASDSKAPYAFRDEAYAALINLCIDICKRNGKKKLLWFADKARTLAYEPKADEMVLSVHRWFAAKSCIPVDSEVLTKNGWVKLHDIQIGDEIACADIDNLRITFEEVYDKVPERDQDTYTNNGFTATKDHRCVYRCQTQNEFRIENYKHLLSSGQNVYLPLAGFADNEGLNLTDDELRLMVAVQADGHYMHENRHGEDSHIGLEFHLKKDRKIERVKHLLDSCHFEYTESRKADGSVSIRVWGKEVVDECEKILTDKCFDWEWINMNRHQAMVFLSEILFWDGCSDAKLYSSRQQINLDVVSAIAALNGVGSNVTGSNILFRQEPFCTVGREDNSTMRNNKQHGTLKTRVSCVSVKTGIFLIRQNGKTFITGNCPGDWMYARMGELASKVTAALSGDNTEQPTTPDQPVEKTGLKKGDKGEDVRQMQTMLIACGYSCGSTGADGDFGKNTLAGLVAFQTAAGLTADGVYGEADKAALEGKYKEAQSGEGGKTDEQVIWDTLMTAIGNAHGVAGLMGNLKAESNLHANNLQNNGNTRLGMTDAEFTAAYDSGAYPLDTFIHDGYGYGLAQWSFYSRKAALAAYALDRSVSIGDLSMQLGFLLQEIKGYTKVWEVLATAKTVREASDAVLLKFERPADQSTSVQEKRAAYGQTYYDKYATTAAPEQKPEEQEGQKQEEQKPEEQTVEITATQAKYINSTGTHWISNSGSDERGQYTGGQAGDQTGKEWRMRDWYSRPWGVILRYPDQRVALLLAQLAIDAALNDKIGYDQSQNRTYLKQLKAVGWEPSRITVACEADCSAGVCANVTAAGYLLGIPALQNHTGTYTGNMRKALVKAGFKELTDSKYLTSGDYLLPGDILLLESHHTATNVTIGKKVRGDWNPGKAVTPTTPDIPVPTETVYYRVRHADNSASSQIGAFTKVENAKLMVDANPGYYVFLDGKIIYPVEEQTDVPFKVRVAIDDLNIRTGAGTNYSKTGKCTGKGVFTIVEIASGEGSDSGWGRLKSGAGWISLDYCQRL